MKHFEASLRESLSKVGDKSYEHADTEDLVNDVGILVKNHLETSASLSKRKEELAASKSRMCNPQSHAIIL